MITVIIYKNKGNTLMSDLTEFEKYCQAQSVVPLSNKKNILITKSNVRKKANNNNHLYNQQTNQQQQYQYDGDNYSPQSYCRNGQNKLIRQLASAKIDFDKVLDFHGYNVNQAITVLDNFINFYCQRAIICIIHGKGINSINRVALLKVAIHNFLINHNRVLAYTPAHIRHGGSGATCCCIAKSKV